MADVPGDLAVGIRKMEIPRIEVVATGGTRARMETGG